MINRPRLSPDEAIHLMETDPASVFFDLDNASKALGISHDELIRELSAGRLVATGFPMKDRVGFTGITISGDQIINCLMADTLRRAGTEGSA